MQIKLVSYNIQFGYGQDWVYDLGRIADTVRGQDIICLQEVTTNWQACNGDDQPEVLARDLGLFSAYAPGFEVGHSAIDEGGAPVNRRRGFGNMVLSRWPIVYSRAHSLPRTPVKPGDVPAGFYPLVDLPRTALETVVDVPGRPLRVISIHLSHLPGAQRAAQIETLRQIVASVSGEAALWQPDPSLSHFVEDMDAPPVPGEAILCGDFNLEPTHAEYGGMTAFAVDGWVAAGEDRGSADGGSCVETDGRISTLDYGLFSDGLAGAVSSARVDQGNKSSDHFPLFFELEL